MALSDLCPIAALGRAARPTGGMSLTSGPSWWDHTGPRAIVTNAADMTKPA